MVRREIVIAHDLGEVWMALVEKGRVLELDVREAGARSWLGTILKARVVDTAPGVSGCFLEVGSSRPAFLVEERPGRIADLAKGDELIVQIVREPDGSKGLRASRRINLSGDYVVLLPGENARAISRRIEDEDERVRLEAVAKEAAPEGHGVILRTAAGHIAGMKAHDTLLDHDRLFKRVLGAGLLCIAAIGVARVW